MNIFLYHDYTSHHFADRQEDTKTEKQLVTD